MIFKFKHPESGEIKTVTFSAERIQNELEYQIKEELTCDCEPVGETNVIECNCEDYFCEFELQERDD